MKGVLACCFAVALATSSTASVPQASSGRLVGTVYDPDRAVVPDAEVRVQNSETGWTESVRTGADGVFIVPLLPPGVYDLVAAAPGFAQAIRSRVVVRVGSSTRVDIELAPGSVSEAIEVGAGALAFETRSAVLGSIVDRRSIDGVPQRARDIFDLAKLVPGATAAAQGSQNSSQGGAFVINGMREQTNGFLLDGAPNNEIGFGQIAVPVPIESIAEVKIQSGAFSPGIGFNGGGQVSVVTRSGGNDLHATGYLFVRNAFLDARNFFSLSEKGPDKHNRYQFGVSVSGPIVEEHTFFFANVEQTVERKGVTRLAVVPPPEQILGDFGSHPVPIVDPETGVAFPDNLIPESSLSEVGRAIASFYPAPNVDHPSGNLLSSPTRRVDATAFLFRADHRTGTAGDFTFRVARSAEDRFEPFDPLLDPTNIPGFGGTADNGGANALFGWTFANTPDRVNDFRFSWSLFEGGRAHETQGNDIASALGISGLDTKTRAVGFPGTRVVGFDDLLEPFAYPNNRRVGTFEVDDNSSWVAGRHLLSFGGQLRHTHLEGFLDTLSRGLFVYTGQFSGHPLADLLLGRPTLTIRSTGESDFDLSAWAGAGYVHDEIRLHSRFTVTAGIRYEWMQPPVERFDNFFVPDLTAATPTAIGCGSRGIHRACQHGDYDNFAPRLGMAWMAAPDLVVRAGYGLAYDAGIWNVNIVPALNPPRFQLATFFPDFIDDPFPSLGALDRVLPFFQDADMVQGYYQTWSLDIQRDLGKEFIVQAGYVGTKGTKLQTQRNLNQPRPGGSAPFPAYGPVGLAESAASSIYHGFTARAQRHASGGITILATYTWSKSIDDASAFFAADASGFGFPQNSGNRRGDRGLSDFDNRHSATLSHVWDLPWGSGWRISGVWTARSARPLTAMLIGTDASGTGNGFETGFDRPHLIGDPNLDNPDPARWFDTSVFVRPEGTFGSAGRNIIRGPGYARVDLAVTREWPVREMRAELRLEGFNIFNHANFDLPTGDFNSPVFGRVTSAADPRQFQAMLRFSF